MKDILKKKHKEAITNIINDINLYIINKSRSKLNDYDEIVTLFEKPNGSTKIDMYFYTIDGKQVFSLKGTHITQGHNVSIYPSERLFDIEFLWRKDLLNLVIYLFLKDDMKRDVVNLSHVVPEYRLSREQLAAFRQDILVYFM